MSEPAIEAHGLGKQHPRDRAGGVRDLDLTVARGEVHGLLGPLGSGKTTVLRLLVGLARPTTGRLQVLGEDVPRRLARVMPRVGASVGTPHFVGGLSGRRHLELLASSAGVPRERVEVSLDRVGLAGRADDRYRRYPAPIRQRLALAAALLKPAELVLLDEPTQGMDPAGVRLVREIVRELAEQGVTVVLASHLLGEVQRVCDAVTVLDRGRALANGPVEDVVGRDRPDGVWVGVADPAAARLVLTEAGLRVTREGPQLYVEGAPDPARVTRLLADHRIYVRELVPDRPDLESVVADLAEDAP